MPSKKLKMRLIPEKYYHIYNRGNNKEKLFFSQEDYYFFLDQYRSLVGPYVKTYAFCLMPNHFHFLIFVKEDIPESKVTVSNQFRKLFILHTMRINSLQNRVGSLFTKNFQRIEVKNDFYLKMLVVYIHRNPFRHGLMLDFQSYRYSSFTTILLHHQILIEESEVINWFGGKEEYLYSHFQVEIPEELRDVHYLEQDGVPPQGMESLALLSTSFYS
jgi:putative transposase